MYNTVTVTTHNPVEDKHEQSPKIFALSRRDLACFAFECWYDIHEDEPFYCLDDIKDSFTKPRAFKRALADGMTCCLLPNFSEIEEWYCDPSNKNKEFIIIVLNDDRKSVWAVINSKVDEISW